MNIIRKLSIGSNYKEAMHYLVGQDVFRGKAHIHAILKKEDTSEYQIWVKQEDTIMFWKAFNFNMPVSVEHDLNF